MGTSLYELGPKKNKGGAPRLFLYRGRLAEYFVAAGMEKGNTGVREISTARDRAAVLAKREKTVASLAEMGKRISIGSRIARLLSGVDREEKT